MNAKLRTIYFTDRAGRRKAIRLGRVTASIEAAVREHVTYLRVAALNGRPVPAVTLDWLASIGDRLYRRLSHVHLVPPREVSIELCKLKSFCDSYLKRRSDLKGRTRINMEQAAGKLVGYFGRERDLRTITRGEAKDWHRNLRQSLAAATVATHTKKARQIFDDAMDRRLISDNPFRAVKAGRQDNPDRAVPVSVATVLQAIGACPDSEWRLIFALARFAALRIPSELLPLKWTDVDWGGGGRAARMRVSSPKTAHCGKSFRIVPISPLLMPYLREAFELAPAGTMHVIRLHRGENLRTMAEKIIRRAGLKQWPRLFQNLRASMETDWATTHPLHVACAWAGNTEVVAKRHYLQVTEEHFARAQGAAPGGEPHPTNHEHGGAQTPVKEGESQVYYPQGVDSGEGVSRRIINFSSPAVRKVLRRVAAAGLADLRQRVEQKGGRDG